MGRASEHLAIFLSGLAGGGAQRRMLLLARGFAERGYRVDVVVARAEGPYRAAVPASVRLVALDARLARLPGIRTRRGLWVLATAPALATWLARERPDAVLATSTPANLAALAARALSRTPVRVVPSVNLHVSGATGPQQPAWAPALRALVQRAYPKADALIAVSASVAEDLARLLPPPRPPIVSIPNPVPLAEIEQKARAPLAHAWLEEGAPPLVLAVGKLRLQKDYPTLIRAFARLRARRPARLLILGEGKERPRLERLVRALALAQDVSLPGFEPNPWAWMARASVLALSSAFEGFSNVVAEALACGCPVVATNCPGGVAELLEHGVYGALVPVGDDAALARALLETLEKPRDAQRLRARAAAFPVDTAVDRYLEVLVGPHAARPD
jgi:glycosyltransferase involved in cell wall biosynthesis